MHIITNTLTNLVYFAKDTCTGKSVTVQGTSTPYDTCLPGVEANGSALSTIIRLVFGVIGALAVIYMMYGAFRYVRSQGEPKEINQARQTIIYAVIGLVIAVSAELIVSLALEKF